MLNLLLAPNEGLIMEHASSSLNNLGSKGLTNSKHGQSERAGHASNVLPGLNNMEGMSTMDEMVLQNNRQAATTVSWLNQNYESSEGYSLPRCLIYEHYIDFCQRKVLLPVNAASFGKTIRQVFPGLKTRRLGTRGQSKYHYYGIKVRSDSPYYNTLVASQRMSLPCPSGGPGLARALGLFACSSPGMMQRPTAASGGEQTTTLGGGGGATDGGGKGSVLVNLHDMTKTPEKEGNMKPIKELFQPAGLEGSSLLPAFPKASELANLPDTLDHGQVDKLLDDYRTHCCVILEVIMRGGLDEVEYYMKTFWNSMAKEQRRLLEYTCMCDALAVCDTYLYHTIVSVLIPGTLNPVPPSFIQSIRHFSNQFPWFMKDVLQSFPEKVMQHKMPAVERFSRLMKRKTSLAHLSQASRSALAVDVTINQMRVDWEKKTELDTVCSQLMWTMPNTKWIRQQDIRVHMDAFKGLLESQATVEEHIKWVEEVRVYFVEKGFARGSKQHEKAESAFFMGWCYVCELIIRDQTLRSATSFGSFHLLTLLYGEYLLYVIEVHRYQREEMELWKRVMGLDKPMCEGFLLPDVDLEADDYDDLLDMSTTSFMTTGSQDDFFSDDVLSQECYDKLAMSTPDKQPAINQFDIIPLAFAASTAVDAVSNSGDLLVGSVAERCTPKAKVSTAGSQSQMLTTPTNAGGKESTKSATPGQAPTFVTTKLVSATLLPSSEQQGVRGAAGASLSSSSSAIAGGVSVDTLAPPVLTLNVPVMPGLDLHKGQFLTAGDGNRYVINNVQTVLQPVKETG